MDGMESSTRASTAVAAAEAATNQPETFLKTHDVDWRASIFCHSAGMNPGLNSGASQASRYSRNNWSRRSLLSEKSSYFIVSNSRPPPSEYPSQSHERL